VLASIRKFLEWLTNFFLPQEHYHARVLYTLKERGRCTISVVVREQPRAIATYLATPLYATTPKVQIWIYCDHLSPIAGDPVRSRVLGATHRIIVAVCKLGTQPSSATLHGEPWAGDFNLSIKGKSIAVPVTEILARALIENSHDLIDWDAVAKSAIAHLTAKPTLRTGDRARIARAISHHLKNDPPVWIFILAGLWARIAGG
jgi:hypothetical protein